MWARRGLATVHIYHNLQSPLLPAPAQGLQAGKGSPQQHMREGQELAWAHTRYGQRSPNSHCRQWMCDSIRQSRTGVAGQDKFSASSCKNSAKSEEGPPLLEEEKKHGMSWQEWPGQQGGLYLEGSVPQACRPPHLHFHFTTQNSIPWGTQPLV